MSLAVDLSGRVALVTGGTRGVGRGIAQRLADAGAEVVVCGRTPPEDATVGTFLQADIRDVDQVGPLVNNVVERFGSLDVLINNAGGAPPADAATASPRFAASIVDLN